MKKVLCAVLCLMLALSITACQNKQAPPTEGDPSEINTGFTGKIIENKHDTLLLAGTGANEGAGHLYTLGLKDLKLTSKGNQITPDQLKAGMLIELTFSGEIMESYPMQFSLPQELKVMQENDDLVGFYFRLIKDIYHTDPGLNGDISILAFDLNAVENLSEAEKHALLYLAQTEFGHETLLSTYEELADNGLIDTENLYFETGILITFSNMSFTENSFNFSLEKWRSGLGAYIFADCTATKSHDGSWTYTIGSELIS